MLKKFIIICLVVVSSTLLIAIISSYIYKSTKCPVTPTNPREHKNWSPGCFDYYAFAQLWLPESCIYETLNGKADPYLCMKLSSYFNNKLSPHGLWPSFNSTSSKKLSSFPAYCSNEKFDPTLFSPQLQRKLQKLYPPIVENLPKHEWVKHGTCSGKTQKDYFSEISQYNQKLLKMSNLISNLIGKSVSYKQLINAYSDKSTNIKAEQQHVNILCNEYNIGNIKRQYLDQITTYWTKEGKPLTIALDTSDKKRCKIGKPIYIRHVASFISLEEWMENFNSKYDKPTVVGFDVDDTLLFSSPGLYYLMNDLGLKLTQQIFWDKMNNGLDKFSVPKKVGKELIKFHQDRGDTIYIITARLKSSPEKLSEIIKSTFNISKKNFLTFTNAKSKTPYLKKKGIKVYYGDADTDILSSIEANIQGVRIMRASNSVLTTSFVNGAFGETVILNSNK